MLINRDNYENFFLLYVDAELSAADMKTVEEFAAANEDLQQELMMLKEAVLPLDEIMFEDKGELFRPVPIDAILQEKLLFKIDSELPEYEVASLAGLIATDKNVRAEFELLKRTKLDASEKIIFEDKESLYRRERAKVVMGKFVRWAAAAILLGFGLFFGASLLNDNKTTTSEDVTVTAGIKGTNGTAVNGTQQDTQKVNTASQNLADVNAVQSAQGDQQNGSSNEVAFPATKNDARKNNGINSAVVNVKKDNSNTTAKNIVVPKDNVQRDNDQLAENGIQKRNQNNLPTPETVNPTTPVNMPIAQAPKVNINNNNIVPLESAFAARTASFDEDKNENKILYMDEDNVKRSKLGGFFRKVKRFAERTAKIKSGGNVSIAGFELAAK